MTHAPSETTPSLDAAVFPRTAAYLASLPEGLVSYPACETRREYSDFIAKDFPQAAQHPKLPPSIAQAISFETDKRGWIPDVHCLLHMHIIWDLYFDSKAAFMAQHYVWCKKSCDHPLYKAAMYCISPKLSMIALRALWSRFNLGTHVTSREGPSPNSRYVTLSHPDGMYDAFNVEAIFVAIQAMVSPPSGRNLSFDVIELTRTAGTALFHW